MEVLIIVSINIRQYDTAHSWTECYDVFVMSTKL